jgi:HK97 family phage portal protein
MIRKSSISAMCSGCRSYHAVYACITLIANDIGKLRHKLVEQDPKTRIWSETTNSAFSPVLRRPNNYQNHIQFKEWWITSKLINGNAYALKQRDGRGVVTALYLLDPLRVKPLVTPTAEVYYELKSDNMAGLEAENVVVPASEIIHDRMNCLFHPLIGTSPIFAAGVAATQGINIQNNSATFFGNASRPSGVLTAPGAIGQETADRLKEAWETKFSGENAGKVAVLGDGLKYERMTMSAEESQLIDQLKWTAEVVLLSLPCPSLQDRRRADAHVQQYPGAERRILQPMPSGPHRGGGALPG